MASDSGAKRVPLLCTVEEASEMLCIGRTKIYRLIGSGELRTVRIGRRRLVPLRELEAFIDDLLEAS